jgi:hypothetical protein
MGILSAELLSAESCSAPPPYFLGLLAEAIVLCPCLKEKGKRRVTRLSLLRKALATVGRLVLWCCNHSLRKRPFLPWMESGKIGQNQKPQCTALLLCMAIQGSVRFPHPTRHCSPPFPSPPTLQETWRRARSSFAEPVGAVVASVLPWTVSWTVITE